jgi:hypothetical protein
MAAHGLRLARRFRLEGAARWPPGNDEARRRPGRHFHRSGRVFRDEPADTHADPTFVVDGVIHYCVANMPGAALHAGQITHEIDARDLGFDARPTNIAAIR